MPERDQVPETRSITIAGADFPDSDRLMELLAPAREEKSDDLDATQARIARVAESLFKADSCIVLAVDPITGRFLARRTAADLANGKEPIPDLAGMAGTGGLLRRILVEGVYLAQRATLDPDQAREIPDAMEFSSLAGAALRTRRGKPLAAVVLTFRQPQAFGEAWSEALKKFAWHAARRVQNTWFLQRDRVVAQIGEEINRGLDTSRELFQRLQTHLGEVIDTSRCLLLAILQPANNTLDLYARIDCRDEIVTGQPLQGACRWVIEHRQVLFIERLSEQSHELPAQLEAFPAFTAWEPESLLFVPLLVAGEALGALSVQHPVPATYDAEDRRILELLANHVALAVNNFRLFDSLRLLNEVGQKLTQFLESEEALDKIVELIRTATGCDVAVLFPYVQATDKFLPSQISGTLRTPGARQPSTRDDVAYLAVRKGSPLFATDSQILYESLGGDPKERRGNFEEREGVRSSAVLALRVGGETVGVLFVNFRTPQRFAAPQQHLIGGLASYAAIAIKNAREFSAQSRRHLEELEILQTIDRELGLSAGLQKLLDTILDLAVTHVKAEIASILLYNPQRNELRIEAAAGTHRELQLGTTLRPEDKGITRLVLAEKHAILVDDVHSEPWRGLFVDIGGETVSELDVPLLDGGEVVGILNFESPRPAAFRKKDVEFLSTLAGQAVLAVKRAQEFETEKRLAEERRTLIELGKELTRQLEVSKVLGMIVRHARAITGSQYGLLVLLDPVNRSLEVAAEEGNPDPQAALGRRFSLQDGIVGLVARRGAPLNLDVTKPPWNQIHQHDIPGIQSQLAVPLAAGSVLRGVLSVESPELDHYQEGDENLIQTLADFAVIALQNAERYEQAERRRKRLRSLHEAGQEVLGQLRDPDLAIHSVVEHALRLSEATKADLALYEAGVLTVFYETRIDGGGNVATTRIFDGTAPGAAPPPLGIMRYVAQTQQSYRTAGDAQQDPLYAGDRDIHSELAVPLVTAKGELAGIINAESSKEPDAFDEDDEAVLALFAAQALVAIENARNYARAERERERFEFLYKAGQDLGELTDVDQLEDAYGIVLRIAEKRCACQVVVRRQDPATGELVLMMRAKEEGAPPLDRHPGDQGLNGQAASERRTLVVPDADHPPPRTWPVLRTNPKDHSFIVTPIQFRQSYYGNLSLSHPVVNYFQNNDVELLQGLARQLAITIHRLLAVRAHQEAEQRAKEAEVMSSVGEQALELTHRMGNDLGLVGTSIRRIRKALKEDGASSPVVETNLQSIQQDVQQVLKLSKGLGNELAENSGGEPATIPVRVLVEDALASLHLGEGVRIAIARQIADDPGEVRVVYKHITSALLNLLTNAVEAMPNGGTLTVGAASDGNRVRVWVRDTGRGIKPENQQKIFKLAYSNKKGSFGFGLWSARRNVLSNCGDIQVESEPGKGATFTIQLPLAGAGAHV